SLEENLDNQSVGEYLVFENEKIKIWTIHLHPGKSLPFHKHCKPYFYTALSGGKSRSYYSTGKIVETTYAEGYTKCFWDLSEENFFIHNLENIGLTTLIFSTVEFKK
uniref:hypothetical protein n=1 Tax=Chryseobacterium sp. OSA05B TaxID=2862650 RepID=UPI001CBB77CD